MDIDSPPAVPATDPHAGHKHLAIPPFSVSFPLPFRVLFLIGLAQFLWAVNLHVLHLIGLNTSWILDFRDNEPLETTGGIELDPASEGEMIELDTLTRRKNARPVRSESGKLYQPVYKLFFLYSAWVGGGWAVFRLVTGADSETMEVWRGSIALVALGPVLGALVPWRGVAERERIALRRYVR
jgi:hypothetical protein